jgi:HAD superfamily hydrolase (TIGR01509 family)
MESSRRDALEPVAGENEGDSGPRIAAVALDMDGLLFDTERIYWQVGDTLLQRRGHRYSSELQARMMGRVGTAAMQQMIDFHDLDVTAEALLEESEVLYGQLLPKLLRPMPGLDQWIDQLLRLGLPFALTTSSRRKFVDVILATQSWSDQLAFILSGDDVRHGKPHPEMYLRAAEHFGVPPTEMLVVEDSGNGCAAGVAAGAHVVAVPSEHTKSQDFGGARLVADSLTDVRLWRMLETN